MRDAYRLAEIERRLDNILRMAVIEDADYNTARVKVRDGDLLSGWLPWLTSRANAGEVSWDAPEIGERVLLLCLSGDVEQGFVLPTFYCDDNPAPANSADQIIRHHKGGARDDYNRVTHTREIELPADGALSITIGTAVVLVRSDAVTITIDGTVITGTANEITLNAPAIKLGPSGGPFKKVARIGDAVDPNTHKIIEGSNAVQSS
jgi:phage baseplate assembly protein V